MTFYIKTLIFLCFYTHVLMQLLRRCVVVYVIHQVSLYHFLYESDTLRLKQR